MYLLMWYDDDRKHTVEQRISAGCEAFRQRYGTSPTVVQVNPSEVIEVDGIDVQPREYVHKNNYWIGFVPINVVIETQPIAPQQATLF